MADELDTCGVHGCMSDGELVFCYDCGKEYCPIHFDVHYDACLEAFIERTDDDYDLDDDV